MASPRVKRLLLSGLPSWIPRASGIPAPLVFDFVGQRSYVLGQWGKPESFLTVSSSANGWYQAPSGLWVNAAANTLRYHANSSTLAALGVLIEEARTNVVLRDRDFTNAAWVKVNITAAKDQVGIDGVTNSASSITATAGNGTILQTIVLASSARFQSAFVQRITGTGTVNMTLDGGLTWTAIAVTAAWTQVTVPTQTLANPVAGFQIVTSGDAIAVDMGQDENGVSVTSPIATTTASVARSADVVSMALPTALQSLPAYTLLGVGVANAAIALATNQGLVSINDGGANNRISLYRTATTGLHAGIAVAATTTFFNPSGTNWTVGAQSKLAFAATSGSQAWAINGTAPTTNATASHPAGINNLTIGNRVDSTGFFNGTFAMMALWPFRVANAELQRLTA